MSLVTHTLYAQQSVPKKLNGYIHLATADDLAGTRVLLLRDSVRSQVTATDSRGYFSFVVPPSGQYLLEISRLGYAPRSYPLDAGTLASPLALTLSANANQLEEVRIVRARLPLEQKADRMILNLEANPIAANGGVLEALGMIPRVSVDLLSRRISVDGIATMIVYVNDRQVTLPPGGVGEFLSAQPANTYSRIEVLTAPPARYDAAGGGVILLYTRRPQTEGLAHELGLMGGVGRFEKASITYNSTLNLSRVTGFLTLAGQHRPSYAAWIGKQEFWEGGQLVGRSVADTYRKIVLQGVTLQSAIDWNVNSRHTLGISVNGGLNRSDELPVSAISFTRIAPASSNQTRSESSFLKGRLNGAFNVNYRWRVGKPSLVSADIDFGQFNDLGRTQALFREPLLTTPVEAQLAVRYPNTVRMGTGKVDFSTTRPNKVRLETGLKYSLVNMDNTPQLGYSSPRFDSFTDRLTSPFRYWEETFAGYVSLAPPVKKWQVQTGLRVEATRYEGTSNALAVAKSYVSLFPNVSASHTTANKYTVTLQANRRLVRPTFDFLNPAYRVYDPVTLFTGNPFLTPQWVTTFQGSFITPKRTSVSVTQLIVHNRITEVIYRLSDSRPEVANTYLNFDREYRTNIQVSVPISVSKAWKLVAVGTGVYSNLFATFRDTPTTLAMFSPYWRVNNTLTLGTWTLTANWIGRGRAVAGYLRYHPLQYVDMGLQRNFTPQSSLKASFTDVFHSMRVRNFGSYLNTNLSFDHVMESRQLLVTYTYKFGNTKLKASARRQSGSESEQERAGGN